MNCLKLFWSALNTTVVFFVHHNKPTTDPSFYTDCKVWLTITPQHTLHRVRDLHGKAYGTRCLDYACVCMRACVVESRIAESCVFNFLVASDY